MNVLMQCPHCAGAFNFTLEVPICESCRREMPLSFARRRLDYYAARVAPDFEVISDTAAVDRMCQQGSPTCDYYKLQEYFRECQFTLDGLYEFKRAVELVARLERRELARAHASFNPQASNLASFVS